LKSKILIKGNFSEGNFGDDALLLACHQLLGNLGIDAVSIYNCEELYYPKDLAANAKVGMLNNKDVELVLYAGGTQFFSFSSEKENLIQNLKKRISAFKWGVNQRSKYAMIGVGLGPFKNGIKENVFAKTIIKKSSFTWVRDEYSYKECDSLGAVDFHLGADLCFLSEFQKWCSLKPNNSGKINKIGIVLRHWKYNDGNAYINKLIELSERLKIANHKLVFYLFSYKEDIIVEDVLKANKIDYLKWDAKEFTFKEFLEELERCDLFITARFHAAIFSTLMQKPFITVGLDQKLTYLSSLFNNDCFNWCPDDSIDALLSKISYIDENYIPLKKGITETKENMQRLSDNASVLFGDYVNSIV